MALTDIVCPPQSWPQFLAQTYNDEEYFRKSAGGVTYSRGGHFAYDLQAVLGDRDMFSVGVGEIEHVDFGDYLGERQFVIRFADGSGCFYAHTASRIADGTKVQPGDYVGRMGNSSSVAIGVHLHLEYLKTWNNWYSPANAGPQLRRLKEQKGMLSDSDKKWLRDMQEFELGQMNLRQAEALYRQIKDTTDANAKRILKQLSDAHKETGDRLVSDSKP